MEVVTIKPMQQEHWEQVKQIYESGIATGIATFETTAPSLEKWDDGHITFARLLAVENNAVVGWTALSPVSSRCVCVCVCVWWRGRSECICGRNTQRKRYWKMVLQASV
jgi:L-amino acid N-acyltransferase YncA